MTSVFLAVGIFLLVFLIFMFAAPPLRTLSSAVWRSSQAWQQSAFFSSAENLQQQNTVLRERVAFLEQQNTLLRERELENFSFASDERTGIPAWVVRRSPYTFARQWVIDQGARSGIDLGALVYAGDVVLGSVTQVSENTSEVTPFFVPGVSTQVIHTPSGMSLSVDGRGQGVYYTEVPRDFEIEEGDLIQWQGTSAHAIIGYVKSVIFDDRDALQQAFIALPMNPKTIQWVEVEVENER